MNLKIFNPFSKKEKKEEEEIIEEVPEEKQESKKVQISESANADVMKLASEIDRIKVSIEGLQEVRKSFSERFDRISEQIGELRSMILERDRTIKEIELKALKAYDLVEAVHPEKIMTEIQRQDAKTEALKANIEGNEAIMTRVMEELKETKRKIEFFRGIEEIIKLSEETKQELLEIKKVESKINLQVDKIETMFAEIRKKYQDIDSFSSEIQEMKVIQQQNIKDINFLKDKITSLATKDELEKLVNKVQRYIEVLKELEKSSSLTKDIATLKTILESLK